MTTPHEALDAAVTECLRVAWSLEASAADAAVTAYERADAAVEALLVARPPGLLSALSAACTRARHRLDAVEALHIGAAPDEGGQRALLVARHAYDRAVSRWNDAVRRVVLEPRAQEAA